MLRLQAGMSVELYEDDVWWKGMVLRKSPAGVFVYLPGGWVSYQGAPRLLRAVAVWSQGCIGVSCWPVAPCSRYLTVIPVWYLRYPCHLQQPSHPVFCFTPCSALTCTYSVIAQVNQGTHFKKLLRNLRLHTASMVCACWQSFLSIR